MCFGRKPKTKTEKELAEKAYKIGMRNGWCSGKYAMMDGDFIVEEDRLNRDSFTVIDDIETLRKFFKHGNWCLGQAAIYKNLVFIQQVNGGDEWLTMKQFGNIVKPFDSVTFMPMAFEYKNRPGTDDYFESYLGKNNIPSKSGHFVDYINKLLKAELIENIVKY